VLDYSQPTAVRLEIRDNGTGVAAGSEAGGEAGDAPGFGLVGVRERAAHVGGSMSVQSSQGGTTLRVEVPG
jgi:signal transduction histidine kinase